VVERSFTLVIASEAKQSRAAKKDWIASSPLAPRNDDGGERQFVAIAMPASL
jgi:hypothetical protein